MKTARPNQSIEPTGSSRFCLSAFVSQRRLLPVAHLRVGLMQRGATIDTFR